MQKQSVLVRTKESFTKRRPMNTFSLHLRGQATTIPSGMSHGNNGSSASIGKVMHGIKKMEGLDKKEHKVPTANLAECIEIIGGGSKIP